MDKVTALESEVKKLRQEVATLRRNLELHQTDPEGEYRPKFVARILKISNQKNKKLIPFTSPEDFLKRVDAQRSRQ